jgi:hypothetical protein
MYLQMQMCISVRTRGAGHTEIQLLALSDLAVFRVLFSSLRVFPLCCLHGDRVEVRGEGVPCLCTALSL